MAEEKAQEDSDASLRAEHRDRKQDDGSGVDDKGVEGRQSGYGSKIGEKDVAERDGKVNQIREVAAVGENCGPFSKRGDSGEGHGKHDEKIFVWGGRLERIAWSRAPQEK